jgi:2-keto-3-deoxy-L-rhamnonate aldolase RhmA
VIETLRERLDDPPSFGTFVKLPQPEVVDVLALAGFDFLICDLEHAQIDEAGARTVIRASNAANVPCLVRLPDPEPGMVNRLLEVGAAGLQVPRIRRASQVKELVEMTRFPPHGRRSVGTANPRASYGDLPVSDYVDGRRPAPVLVGQLETRELEEPVESVLQDLDVAFIGPVDLAVDFGALDGADSASMTAHIRRVESAAAAVGTSLGIFAGDSSAAFELAAAGYTYVVVAGDLTFLRSGAQEITRALRSHAR